MGNRPTAGLFYPFSRRYHMIFCWRSIHPGSLRIAIQPMTSEINPYAAPQSEPAKPPGVPVDGTTRRRKFALSMAIILLVGSPLAAAVAVYDIESIVVSGAILSLIALILIALSVRQDLRPLNAIAGAMLVMSVGCFLTIFLMGWDPREAQFPIGTATVAFAAVVQLGWVFVKSDWESDAYWTSVSNHDPIVDATDTWFKADQ